MRIGGSSAAEAIGVSRFRGNWFGGWSQGARTRELHYIDPSVVATPASYALLGWQLMSDYTVEAPEMVRVRGVPDTDSPGESGVRLPPPPRPPMRVEMADGRTPPHVRVARRLARGV